MPGANNQPDEPKMLNPIALTLALWLGVITGATGLNRLAQDAAAQAALAEAAGPQGLAHPLDDAAVFNPRLMAFGG